MKLRILLFVLAALTVLAGCSMAEDITPPPDYKTPTPAPTLAALFPSVPPSAERGAAFYAEKCAPCHGENGLGNGPLAGQLPVAVPAIALRDIASQSSPSSWFQIISTGRLERGMPGFIAHPDSDRWDVLAYVYTLGTTPEELQAGASLYAAQCSTCHGPQGDALPAADLTDQVLMSSLTGLSIYRTVAEGKGTMPAFAGQLTEDDIWALAAYLRVSTFDQTAAATATPEPTPAAQATSTPESAAVTTPDAATAVEASPTPEVQTLAVGGVVTNGSGTSLPSDLQATLHIFDMQANLELQTIQTPVLPDGSYTFSDLQAVMNSAYWVSLDHQGVSYASEPAMYDGTVNLFELPVLIYDSSQDQSLLSLDQVHLNISLADEATLQVVEIYILSNTGSSTVVVPSDGMIVPFIQLPAEAQNVQYQLANGSESLLGAEVGFAMPPTAGQYGIVAIYTLPYDRKFEYQQTFPLPVNSLVLFVPEGLKVRSDQLTDGGVEEFQGETFSLFQGDNFAAGSTLALTISGKPGSAAGFAIDQRTGILIGLGGLGALLIAAGIALYIRDRRATDDDDPDGIGEEVDAIGEDQDAVLDAILALDERFKAGEIPAEAYELRRKELKSRLKSGEQE